MEPGPVNILGIETSCDETAAAVVRDGREPLSNVVASQVEMHARYGGVVPEVASRQHVLTIAPVVDQALEQAGLGLEELDGIAVTMGPGLAGALLVGVNTAKALAFARGLPLLGINHLEGHIYAAWLDSDDEPEFPLLALIVSGGHSDVVLVKGHGEDGDIPDREELAAAFQESVVDSLVTKAVKAAKDHDARRIVLAGGVAANTLLRRELVERSPLPVTVPPPALCTDNGAMIAAAAYRRLAAGERSSLDLDVEPGLKIG